MWQHSFPLPIKTNKNKTLLDKYVNTCCWTWRQIFILEHLFQIKVTTKFIIINNKNIRKSDPFVELDSSGFFFFSKVFSLVITFFLG